MISYNKKTEGKPNLNKIDPNFIEGIAKVLDYGDDKHGIMNWKDYEDINELTSAMFRHLNQFNSGQLYDNESQYSHLHHIATNAMILQWLIDNNVIKIDNLYYNKINKDEK